MNGGIFVIGGLLLYEFYGPRFDVVEFYKKNSKRVNEEGEEEKEIVDISYDDDYLNENLW